MPHDEDAGHMDRRVYYQTLAQVVSGAQPMTWDIWATPIQWATCLTPVGRTVAAWAVDVLRRTLGEDFLERLRVSGPVGVEHPLLTSAILVTLWSGVDSRRLYEDLFRLAAQLDIARRHGRRWYALRTTLSTNFADTSWTHALLQIELFGLAVRHGWGGAFEPRLRTGRPGDVLLERGVDSSAVRLLFECTSMGWSVRERESFAYFH